MRIVVRKRAAVIASMLGMVVVFSAPAPAHATNWYGASGGTGCTGNMQTGSTMYYVRDSSLSSNMYNGVAWALNNRVAPTDVTVAAEQSSPSSSTDVVYYEANYSGAYCGNVWHGSSGGTMVGFASCQTAIWGLNTCSRFHIYFDQSWDVASTTTQTKRQNLATHETGHSLGLKHTALTSVMNGWTTTSTFHSSHEVTGHINGAY